MPQKKNTDTRPLFTIISVSKDNLDGLKATEKSIHDAKITDYEWIVIDGNSQDGTAAYLKTHENVTYISEDDHGIYDAMNKAIPLANGEYTIFMNAGDCFAQRIVMQKVARAAQFEPSLIYGDALEQCPIKPDQLVFKAARKHHQIHRGLFTHHQAMFYRTDLLKTFNYNCMYKIAADYDLTLRFLKEHPRAVYIPRAVCIFAAGGVSQQFEKRGRIEQQLIRRNELGYNWFNNKSIALTQRLASFIKNRMPPVYWWIRTHTPHTHA